MKQIILFFLILFVLPGCLKNEVTLDYTGIQPIVLIPNANWPVKGYASQPEDSAAGTVQLNLYAKVSYEKPLDKNVLVKFTLDNALADAYNDQWGTAYRLLSADCYEVSSLDLVIPSGAQQAILPITIISEKIDPQYDYILPFTIAAADGNTVASNFKSMIFTLKGQ
ncbi:DUF1735 domain-containing protein [Chitinophaga sp. XS-30]|uniref:DUF1735 domain-containing protein n=1 Tax=Chitinophaga sp. XS-30 TaxID=2604421 RepID=UPI0011DE479F|nr:DUF1735 domain-containing protein [Chitinophaga sp. XS-30]QEH40644.1 DUF1735 domain-containing protein [Chitinophaga sp. XS-30]